MKNPLYFDAETGPLPDDQLTALMPEFKAPSNYRDLEKIKASIAEQAVTWKERAALDAVSGRVLAIGIIRNGQFETIINDSEATILTLFWKALFDHHDDFVGFNSHRFDLPFLWRRSWKLGVTPMQGMRNGRYWTDRSIDLMEVWQFNDRQTYISLDTLAKHLGVGAKNGDGAHFAELLKTDREKAIAYLKNDLELLKRIAERIL